MYDEQELEEVKNEMHRVKERNRQHDLLEWQDHIREYEKKRESK